MMESVFKTAQWAQWTVYGLAILLWLGALAFAGFRIHQMGALKVVEAEVLDAKTKSYMARAYSKDATGWNVETRSRMYSANATVRYEYQGREHIAEASHDVGVSSKWLQDRLTREWKPGSRIRIHIDPAKPDSPLAGLGFNLNTFLPAIALVLFGFVLLGAGYGLGRLFALLMKFQEDIPGPHQPPWQNR
jgi:hypothetical protein